ncbi:MAG: hypothetical protein AB7O59_19785 [Pirellulales bacterium]
MDFDDCFTMELLWRKKSPSPLRVRVVYNSAECTEDSFELPALDVIGVFGEALKDADSLLLQEVGSVIESFRRLVVLDGDSSSQLPANREAIPASA